MTVHSANWLDWLRNPRSAPADKMALLERAASDVSRRFQKLLMGQASVINKEAGKIAGKFGVDGLYVVFNFVRPTRYWPSMPPKMKEALEIAQLIVSEAGAIPPFGSMSLPPHEMEPSADAALIDLASWTQRVLLPKIQKDYYKIVEKAARPHVRDLRRDDDPAPPLVDVASQVSGYFRHRVEMGRELSPLRLLMLRTLSAFGS